MHDAVHCSVGEFGGPLCVSAIQGVKQARLIASPITEPFALPRRSSLGKRTLSDVSAHPGIGDSLVAWSQPNHAPSRNHTEKSARMAADSAPAGSKEAMISRKEPNSSGPPCTGSAQTSKSLKSGAIWAITQGCASWAEIGDPHRCTRFPLGVRPAQDGDDDHESPHRRSDQKRWRPARPPGQQDSRGGVDRADQEDDLAAVVGGLALGEREQDRARDGQHQTERVPPEYEGSAGAGAVAEPCGVQGGRESVDHQPTDERMAARENET